MASHTLQGSSFHPQQMALRMKVHTSQDIVQGMVRRSSSYAASIKSLCTPWMALHLDDDASGHDVSILEHHYGSNSYLASKGYGLMSYKEVDKRQKHLLGLFDCEKVCSSTSTEMLSDSDAYMALHGCNNLLEESYGSVALQVGFGYLSSKGYGSMSFREVLQRQRQLLGLFGGNFYEVDNIANNEEDELKVNGVYPGVELVKDVDNRANDGGGNNVEGQPNLPQTNGAIARVQVVREGGVQSVKEGEK